MSRAHAVAELQAVRFAPDDGFHAELRDRVRRYFEDRGLSPRGERAMWTKTAVIVAWLVTSYLLLVFVANNLAEMLLLSVSLGLAMAGAGFNLQHDGSHGSYSHDPRLNRLMARALDFLGASSYIWKWKHNVFHHTWPNLAGLDDDVDAGPLARFSSDQPRHAYHRFQHFYLWPLYGFLAAKWQLFDDWANLLAGRLGDRSFPRPRGFELFVFVGGKIVFYAWALGLPLLIHPPGVVVLAYLTTTWVLGLTLSVVFQLAHCVPQAGAGAPRAVSWAKHQAKTAVDFARDNRLLTWYVGGLNFQIEHHLLPRVCHVHYRALSPLVEDTCREFGVPYAAHPTFGSAIAGHFQFLRTLGRDDRPSLPASA